MKNDKRSFQGIWIPKEIWLNTELTLQEKLFLVEINSLDNDSGCFANNQYFAEFFEISKVRVSQVINSLVEKKLIISEIDEAKGNKRTLKTLINITLRPSQTNLNDPHKDSFKHSNTINNINNNKTNILAPAAQDESEKLKNRQSAELISIFQKSVKPDLRYSNKTQIAAAKELIEIYGFPKSKGAAEYAVKNFANKFCPTITTPLELKNNMARLVKFKNNNENDKIKVW